MGPILCATRGGVASRRTQERAIELAKERGSDLIFLYVVDTNFAGTVDEAMAVTLTDELRRLGKCLLRLAQKRAREQNLTAQLAVREGRIQQSIEAFIRETGASTLVIGAPRTGPPPQMFDRSELSEFTAAIQQVTGAEVIVVE